MVKVPVALPFAAVASRFTEATSAEMAATPTPNALTERALLKSQNLLNELSKLNFGIDSDTPKNFLGSRPSGHVELDGSDGDDKEEHLERPIGCTDDLDESSGDVSQQVQLLKLASDVWSRVSADAAARTADSETSAPSRCDSKASTPSLPSSYDCSASTPSLPSAADSQVAFQADDDVTRATDLFRDALRAVLRGEVASSGAAHSNNAAIDEHDVDVGRVRALLVKALGPVGEVDQRQTSLGQPPLSTVRVDLPLSPPMHSPHPAHPRNLRAFPSLQPSAQISPQHPAGLSPRVVALPPFATHVAHKTTWPGVSTAVQIGATQAAIARPAVAATSAATVAAIVPLAKTVGAIPGALPCHSTLMTVSTTTTSITTFSTTTLTAYAGLRPRIPALTSL